MLCSRKWTRSPFLDRKRFYKTAVVVSTPVARRCTLPVFFCLLFPLGFKVGERFCAKMGERADTGEPVDAIEELGEYIY